MTNSSEDRADVAKAAIDLYLDLLKGVLTRSILLEKYDWPFVEPSNRFWRLLYPRLKKMLDSRNLEIVRRYRRDPEKRNEGKDWPPPPEAETMVGLKRLDNLQWCVSDIIRRNIPGDLAEAGTWRGGASIFMRAVLKAHGDTTRIVWVADSFEGLPKPDALRYAADAGDPHWRFSNWLAVSLEDVKENFAKYGLLDQQVQFLKGWFRDTLPGAPITRLAILRLDGDMYESTMDTLVNLYPKLSPGGYIIVDDYALAGCKAAVDDFRTKHAITDEILQIDWTGAFWQRRS
jgi:O-methyltransferase